MKTPIDHLKEVLLQFEVVRAQGLIIPDLADEIVRNQIGAAEREEECLFINMEQHANISQPTNTGK